MEHWFSHNHLGNDVKLKTFLTNLLWFDKILGNWGASSVVTFKKEVCEFQILNYLERIIRSRKCFSFYVQYASAGWGGLWACPEAECAQPLLLTSVWRLSHSLVQYYGIASVYDTADVVPPCPINPRFMDCPVNLESSVIHTDLLFKKSP